MQDRIDIRTVQGNAASPRTLETAGARDADMIVALTNSDETNMVACHVAWSLFGTKTKIARIRSRDYTKQPTLFVSTESPEAPMALPGFAIDMYLSPEEAVTAYIERLIRYPGALQVVDFAEGKVRLVGLKALKGGALVGRPIRELKGHMRNSEARVAAMYREGLSIEPDGDNVIQDGDEVFFVAATQDIRAVMKEMQKLEDPVKRVVIAGGGNIGYRLAQTLDDENQVKVIERDSKRARQISETLRNAIVLVGDAADGYPGLSGIGSVGAARLVANHGRIEDFPDGVLNGERREQALLFKRLATLRTDAPLFGSIEEIRWRGATPVFADLASQIGDARLLERARKAQARAGASIS